MTHCENTRCLAEAGDDTAYELMTERVEALIKTLFAGTPLESLSDDTAEWLREYKSDKLIELLECE